MDVLLRRRRVARRDALRANRRSRRSSPATIRRRARCATSRGGSPRRAGSPRPRPRIARRGTRRSARSAIESNRLATADSRSRRRSASCRSARTRGPASGNSSHVLSRTSRPEPARERLRRARGASCSSSCREAVVRMGARRPGAGDPRDGPHLDRDASIPESPIDDVRLAPFFISKFEMTEAQWVRALGASMATLRGLGSRRRRRPSSRSTGTRRRGPSDASDSRCRRRRNGSTRRARGPRRHGGPARLPRRCAEPRCSRASAPPRSAPCGRIAFGFSTSPATSAEWCADVFARYEVSRLPGTGERSALDAFDYRVRRGGSYRATATELRSARRNADSPTARRVDIGVRPARQLDR